MIKALLEYLNASDPEAAKALPKLLWEFREGEFKYVMLLYLFPGPSQFTRVCRGIKYKYDEEVADKARARQLALAGVGEGKRVRAFSVFFTEYKGFIRRDIRFSGRATSIYISSLTCQCKGCFLEVCNHRWKDSSMFIAFPGTQLAILCGSFNPLHDGHKGLLAAAVKKLRYE